MSECYLMTKSFPSDEKFGMVTQIRRAAVSVHLNMSEGFSRKSSAERKRYFEIARGSLIEVDAAIDIANDLKYITLNIEKLGQLMVRYFKLLCGLIQSKPQTVE